MLYIFFFFFSSRRRHTRLVSDWSSDVCSSDLGTDYCLLLTSRYREELRRIEDKHEAMARAVRRAGPAILASGLTVALAMLVLALADNKGTSSLGPVFAIGVACALVAGLTLLPALLTIFGRPGFWPRRGIV